MELDAIIRTLENEVVEISHDDLASLLEMSVVVSESSTGIAGRIRTFRFGDRVLVQERTPKGQIYVRELVSEDAARRFVQSRLDAYERMWDG
jgi:hypothetical protein